MTSLVRCAFIPALLTLPLAAGCRSSVQDDATAGGGQTAKSPARATRTAAPQAEAPRPAPAAVVAEGTTLPLELRTGVSSASSHSGDLVVAVLRQDVSSGGRVVLPAGSELRGRVTAAVRPGKVKGHARLALVFDEVHVRGRGHALSASGIDITAPSTKKHDAALIGGGTAGGAVVGALADGKKGAGIGALVGAAAGGGAVLMTRGGEVELPAGAHLAVRLQEPLRL